MSDNISFLKKYFTTILAALIVLAIAVGSFIFGLFQPNTEDISIYVQEDENGIMSVNPGPGDAPQMPPGAALPSSASEAPAAN